MKSILQYLPLLFLFLFSCKDDDANVELPPATQTGERTFGAYVNGEVWVPKGRPSTFQSNYSVVYEPGYRGGSLEIRVYRDLGDGDKENEEIYIYMSQLDKEGVYKFEDSGIGGIIFYSPSCYYLREDNIFQEGTLEITRFDMEAGIIAGKFDFILAKEGCDTIHVTEGRFDYKLF